jgi:hypothetical protein
MPVTLVTGIAFSKIHAMFRPLSQDSAETSGD